jgi:formylmethanofuran dehydrogenase subunit E
MYLNWTVIPIQNNSLNSPLTAGVRLEKTMKRTLLFLFLCVISAIAVAQAVGVKLAFPQAHYTAEKDDPAWLALAVQLHGHLGPALVFGCRVGMAALDAVGAQGYFDVEVIAQGPFAKPPQSCILDGLQISTGATLGKRNINVVEAAEYVFTVKNKRTNTSVEIRPTPEFLKLMWSRLEADDHEDDDDDDHDASEEMRRVEALSRQIANMPLEKVLTIKKKP